MQSYTLSDVQLTNDDRYLFAKGDWYRSHEKMGAHAIVSNGKRGYYFAVWAPGVRSVAVVGDFNDWNEGANYLEHRGGGIWEGFIAGAEEGNLYKFLIESASGERFYKADPYAFYAECPPGTASRLVGPSKYEWKATSYEKEAKSKDLLHTPLNIFEVHLGSWKRACDPSVVAEHAGEDITADSNLEWMCQGRLLSYDELSDQLVAYVKKMGYSHIEIMPLMEHPFDGSWGYQVTGYFAPTSRYGSPDSLRHFIDRCHEEHIGVIFDWVPGGFCKDAHGLARFNGEKLFEKEEHPNWGTLKFDVGRGEVRSFLISNLLYWISEFHIDGIRMDGVTSILYLNFGVDDPAQKKFNEKGTEEDLDAIKFVQQCNEAVSTYFPKALMIAEESTAWPLVTYPPKDGGLGFHLKWDMGWMNDTLHYIQADFPYRPGAHHLLTFTTMYQFNENFILPLSHDEVVHGKCSLIRRQPGDYWRQFAGMRALALYQMTHAGAKLNFMGNEIAQFIEWRYYEGIQYFLTKQFEAHAQFQAFTAALNALYNAQPAMWKYAYEQRGFEWIDADNSGQAIIAFARFADKPAETLLIVINFEVNPHKDFRIGAPRAGYWKEIFNSDAAEFGGSGETNHERSFKTEEEPQHGRENSLVIEVPPLGGCILKFMRACPKKKRTPSRATSPKASAKGSTRASAKVATSANAKGKSAASEKSASAEKVVSTRKSAPALASASAPKAKRTTKTSQVEKASKRSTRRSTSSKQAAHTRKKSSAN